MRCSSCNPVHTARVSLSLSLSLSSASKLEHSIREVCKHSEVDDMNNPPHLLHHNNGPSSLWCRDSPSLNSRRAPKLFPLILHGERKRGQHFVCDLARAGYSLRFSRGRAATRRAKPSHGKPASFGHMNSKKRMKTQKETEIMEALSKLAPAKPSEDCIARLFEQQSLRLQNNNATFQCAPLEPNTLAYKAPRLEKENFLLYSNGFNRDVKLKPDFSIKILNILTNFKRDNGVIDSQPVENNLGENAMQQHPQDNVFVSSESQREPTEEMERQSRILEEPSSEGTRLVAPKIDEISSCAMLDSSRKGILDSPLVCEGTQDDQVASEESDFSSESSDDDSYHEVENRQGIHELENVSLQHANGLFEGTGTLLSESLPPVLSGKRWSHVFPRHLSRSAGSRSSPSKSSIPGLCSKYSKPEPKANQRSRWIKKPIQLLPNFEVETDPEGEDEEDDVTLNFFPKVHKQPETELEEHISFDWWDSDEEDNQKSHFSTGAKLPMGSKVERRRSELMGNCKLEIESSQLKGEAKDLGSSRSFESLCKQIGTKPEECISLSGRIRMKKAI